MTEVCNGHVQNVEQLIVHSMKWVNTTAPPAVFYALFFLDFILNILIWMYLYMTMKLDLFYLQVQANHANAGRKICNRCIDCMINRSKSSNWINRWKLTTHRNHCTISMKKKMNKIHLKNKNNSTLTKEIKKCFVLMRECIHFFRI